MIPARLRLTQKLAIAFGLALLPVIAMAALLIQRNAVLADEQTRGSILGAALVAAGEVDNYLATAANELTVVAPISSTEEVETRELRFGRLYLERGDFLNVFSVDASGRGTAALFRESGRMPALSGTSLLAEALRSRSTVISAATFPGVGRFPTILVAVPVSTISGDIESMIVGSLSLGRLQLGLQTSAAPHQVLLIDENGRELGRSETTSSFRSSVTPAYPPLVAARAAEEPGVVEFSGEEGDWLAAFAPLATAPWTVVTTIPRSTAFLPTRALIESGAVILLAAVGGSLIAAALLSRVMLRPLARLAETARSLAAGDLNVRASMRTTDETQEVARAFNSMADALSETIAGLERQRAETAAQAHELRRLMERMAHAQEVERSRIAVDIHDSATQLMVGAQFELDSLRLTVRDRELADRLAHATDRVRRAIQAMRRTMFELHPSVLAQLGLQTALEQLAGDALAESGIACRLDFELRSGPLDHDTEIAVFRIAQEALANVRQHSHASSVIVNVVGGPDGVCLQVHDNGRGFRADAHTLFSEPHLGLMAMNERAMSVGGSLQVDSSPGAGTTITLLVRRPSPTSAATGTIAMATEGTP